MSMKQRGSIPIGAGLCGIIMLMAAGAALADASPFVGAWHWNRAQSKLPPGEPAPVDMILDFSRVDTLHVRWSVTKTNAQQLKSTTTYDTPANGEFYPIDSDTTAAFHLNGRTLEADFKGPTGEIDTMQCTLSANGQTMTCSGTMTATAGSAESYVDVYDRR
jgi:hypothetical protein